MTTPREHVVYTFPSSSDNENQWMPLYLSCIAGASTCIGAAIVFCQPRYNETSDDDGDDGEGGKHNSSRRVVPPGMMAFSLSLAGSVMITVSVISILPEVLMDKRSAQPQNDENGGYTMIPIFSIEMMCRILFMAIGAGLYFILSWYLVVIPDPEELIHSDNLNIVLGSREKTTVRKDDVQKNGRDENEVCDEDNSDEEKQSFLPKKEMTSSTSRGLQCEKGLTSSDSNEQLRSRKRDVVVDTTSPGTKVPQQQSRTPSPSKDFKQSSETNDSLASWTSGKDLKSLEQRKAWRVAILMFVSLLVHNFPEGLAVAASALESEKLGITVTIGIMIHNIPEGIAIAIPCLAARPEQPWLSFALASFSGLAEPLGAFVAIIFLQNIKTTESQEDPLLFNLENILAFVAGIMIMVAIWELFPEAKAHSTGSKKFFWIGTISGVVVMSLTELFLP